MSRGLSIAIGLLLAALPVYAQPVNGRVSDAGDGKPLAGAIVRARNKDGNTLKYVMTDKDGRFSIATVPEESALSVALLGYKEKLLEAPFEKFYDISLEASAERIKESVVQARKVRMSGDTTTYNVKALTTRDDLVLGDVLKRIPGIEVTATGHLKVDGKDLGKFYVNGKDVLDNNYNLATKKLSVDLVKKVEVMRNHQYIKLLQGMQESDQPAVNIVMDEKAKGKVNFLGSFRAGGQSEAPYIPHSENLTAFYLEDGLSSVNDAGFDASGNPGRDVTWFRLPVSDNRYSIQSKLNMASAKAPLSDSRSLFNKTFDSRTVNTLTPGEDVKVGATFGYAWDERTSSDRRVSTYHLADGADRTITRDENRLERGNKLTGKLSYSKNSSNHYVSDALFADIGKTMGMAEVSGDDSRSELGERRVWDLNNNLNTLFKTGSGKAVGIKSYTQITGFNESLDILSGSPREDISSSAIFQDLSLNSVNKSGKNLTFNLQPSLRWTFFERGAKLKGLTDEEVPGLKEDKSRASYFTCGLTWSLFYRKQAFSAGLDGNLHYDHAAYGSYKKGKLIPDESLKVKYETGRWVVSAEGGISTKRPDIQDLGSVLILYDYDGLRRGQESLAFLPNLHVTGEVIFREPVSGWYSRLTSTCQKTRNLLGGRDVLENYILSYNTDETVDLRTWASSAEISKGLYSINGKITARLTHFRNSSVFRQNGISSTYVSQTVTPSLEVNTSILGFWNINGKGSLGLMNMYSAGEESGRTRDINASVTNSFHITGNVSAGVVADLFHNSTVGKTVIFPDAFMSWRGPGKLRLKLQASNILNLKEYSYVSLGPLMETSYSFRIRPFSLILSADWTI